jgi:hypothetical protein
MDGRRCNGDGGTLEGFGGTYRRGIPTGADEEVHQHREALGSRRGVVTIPVVVPVVVGVVWPGG